MAISNPKYTGHAKPFALQTFHGTRNKGLTEEYERPGNK